MISARFCHARLAFHVSPPTSIFSACHRTMPCRPFGTAPNRLCNACCKVAFAAEAVRDARRDPKLLLHETVSLSSCRRLANPKRLNGPYPTANASRPVGLTLTFCGTPGADQSVCDCPFSSPPPSHPVISMSCYSANLKGLNVWSPDHVTARRYGKRRCTVRARTEATFSSFRVPPSSHRQVEETAISELQVKAEGGPSCSLLRSKLGIVHLSLHPYVLHGMV